jgi:hypothetical protein
MAAVNRPVPKSQYHHYIPRFLLRRFSSPSLTTRKDDKKRNRRQREDDMVTAVGLEQDVPKFVTSPVGRIFGQFDMYKDDSAFSEKEQDRIEKKLSVIEGHASRVIAKVADAYKAGKNEVTLSRFDKDLLRKYIFVMKYRSPIFYERFNHQKAEDYSSDDRAVFLEYMRERGFKRPLDVWFHNLLKIIDTHMDPAGEWTADLSKHVFSGDAMWLQMNIRSMYLSFVTPSDADEEFLLTSNAFGIHEGPTEYSTDPYTGKQERGVYTEFHVISVISPHLVMVLRNNLLPERIEDQRDEIRSSKRFWLALQLQAHSDPDNATSLLQDLPVTKARNSYTVIQNGRLESAEGADTVPRAKDQFHFAFFRLESRHVQMINLVMLDQAYHSSHIVYKSKVALRAALDFYLDFPTQTRGIHSLKTITERPDDPMLLLLQKLETIAHSLGSSVKAKYYVDPLVEINDTPPPLDGAPSLNEVLPLDEVPPLDADLSFDEIVSQVLKTANTDFLADDLASTVIALPMTVMIQVLVKQEMTVMSAHALDLILIVDHRPCFPDMVFSAVQKAHTRDLSERTRGLVNVDLMIWRHGWDMLVKRALQAPGVTLDQSVNAMREVLSQLPSVPFADHFPALASVVSRDTIRYPEEAPVRRPSSYSDIKVAPGRPRQERREAHNYVARDVQRHGSVSEAIWLVLSALFFIALVCFCLAVLAWKLIGLAWVLVIQTWNLTVLIWSLAL